MSENDMLLAKYKFLKDYATKISYLGCTLSAEIAWHSEGSKDADTIEARINSVENISNNIKKNIEDIIPKEYLHWDKKIPIRLCYVSTPKAY